MASSYSAPPRSNTSRPLSAVSDSDAALERATMRRVTARLIPFVFVLYIFNFLDRSNVGLAALQMNRALGFSPAAFSLGAGIFFLGYALFEVPSNLLLVRIGPRRWIARIMITWGALAAGLMFVRTPMQFYVVRFLLGVAEAGFFPAILYYLSQWYPAAMRARSSAWFMTAIPLSATLGGPLGGWLLGLNGRAGLAGWQWLFLVEGLPSVALGLLVLRLLPESPARASWLTNEQRAWLAARLERDRETSSARHGLPPLRALAHPLIWLVAIPELFVTTAGYAYVFWAPTMLRESLHLGQLEIGWLMAGIAVVCAIAMTISGWSSDRTGDRVHHAGFCALVVALGCAGAGVLTTPVARMTSLALGEVGVIAFLAPFWTLPTIMLSGGSAAVGIALVSAIGSLAGFIGPNVIAILRERTGGDDGAFFALAAMAFVASLICVSLRWTSTIRKARKDGWTAVS